MDLPAEPAARLDPEQLDRVTTFFRLIWVVPIAIVASVLTATATETVVAVTESGDQVYAFLLVTYRYPPFNLI